MAVEQIRPVEGQRKAAQRKTPELNVDTAITILFGTSRLEGDSFISTLRYARNEGMLEMFHTNRVGGGMTNPSQFLDNCWIGQPQDAGDRRPPDARHARRMAP